MTNVNYSNLGSENHGSDVFMHKMHSKSSILSHSKDLSPEEFFYIHGKYPPSHLNVSAPDPLYY